MIKEKEQAKVSKLFVRRSLRRESDMKLSFSSRTYFTAILSSSIIFIFASSALAQKKEGISSNPSSKKKPAVAKVMAPPKLVINGKTFKIKTLSPVTVKVDESVARPEPYTSMEKARLKMPPLLAGLSPISPTVPPSELAIKLPPLIRYTLRINWQGDNEPRLLPEWSAPAFTALEVTPREMESYTDGEFRILEALVLLKSTDTTAIAAGLANPLLNFNETRSPANEILGVGLSNLNIRTASQEHFKKVLNLEKESPRAKRSLINAINALKPNDYADAQFLAPYAQKMKLTDNELKSLPLAQARDAIYKKDLESAWNSLAHVPEGSDQAFEASFLKAMALYRSNNVESAKTELETLLPKLQQFQIGKKSGTELKSLAASTLAQIYFQQSYYKKAYDTYRLIDQEHPLWLESLVESAWSQILLKDYEGAAGNMFSLHTNYFKGAYKPESYIVRTVSYLQLCQFGDALSVLKDFLRKYKYAQNQIQNYKKKNPDHFDVIRDFLKAGTPKNFAGLPRSLLIEIARDSKFIELQRQLNELEDDSNKMGQLSAKVEELDQKFLQNQSKYAQLLKELEGHMAGANNPTKKDSLLAEKSNYERHLKRLTLLRKIIQESKQGLVAEIASFTPIWNQTKNKIKAQQNTVLQASFQNLESDLRHWLSQSELLYYEIHSGAGEHLRYQMATNAPKKEGRTPASEKLKAFQKEDKDLQWAFDGEIWEDEVGHYRSSLKNVCPEENNTQLGNRKPSSETSPVANSEDGN